MPDTSNPYDALLQQDTARSLRTSMMDAVGKAPDAEARLQALARDYSMPVDAVRLRLPEIEQRAKLDAVDYDSLAQRYPKASNMLADPQQAAVAHDDVDNLTTLEKVGGGLVGTAKYLFSAPGAKNTLMGDIGAGIYGASEGYSGVARAALEAAATPLDAFMRPAGNPLRQAADFFAADARVADAKAKALSPAQSGIVGGGVSSGVQSFAQNLLTLPMALLPGGQVPALLIMSGTQGGQSYQEAREAGVGQWQALAHGTSQAMIEYATEMIPLHKLIGDVKAGTPLLKSLMHNAALEVPGEEIATALQDMNDWATLHPEKPFSDYLAERPGAAAQTLIATLIGVGGNVTLGHAMQAAADNATGTVRTAQQAEAHAQVLNTLVRVAEASRLRERDPAQFSTFMQSVVEDGAPNLFVDARTLATMPQLHEIAMALPSVAEQIADAAQTGGDVAIPTAELLTAGPGHEFMQGLLDHARTDPEAMSPVQAREYMQSYGDQLKADMDKVLAEKEGDQTWQQMRDQVRDEFKAQLDQAKRFTPDVNDQYAGLLANFYSVTAAKAGMAPMDLVQRYGLQVRGDALPGGRALDQTAYHGTPHRGIGQFDTAHIGRGEGNQSFGWGLYFAGKKEVAEWYRSRTTAGNKAALQSFAESKGASPELAGKIASHYAASKGGPFYGFEDVFRGPSTDAQTVQFRADHIIPALNDGSAERIYNALKDAGQLYEVEIPEDSDMLHFDKPITSQPDKVKQILKDSGLWKELKDNLSDFGSPSNTRGKLNGENIYAYLAWKLGSEKAASEKLLALGIPGLKYPGGTISGVKNAGHNYVIFHGEHVQKTGELYQTEALSETIEIDGQQRPTTNSNGQPIAATEEGVRNFWRWFGDSKVVDADGRPLVVYHGTAADFAEFDPAALQAEGIHLSARPETANTYALSRAMDQGRGANVMPVFVSADRVLDVPMVTTEAIRQAASDGFDAVRRGDHIVVMRSEQIKSAIGNRGTFDPKDASILNQFAGTNAKTADTHALATAQARIDQGDDAEAVRRETGWHQGVDGKWRFEISDHDAKLLPALQSLKEGGYEARPVKSITYQESGPGRWNVTLNPENPQRVGDFVTLQDVDVEVLRAVMPENAVRAIERGAGFEDVMGNLDPAKGLGFSFQFDGMNALPLSKVIDHPRLFAAYPQLADVLVQVDPNLGVGGAFVTFEDGNHAIRIGRGQQLTTLLHEIQHGIQSIEGFATGGSPTGNPAAYEAQANAELRDLLDTDPRLSQAFDAWAKDQVDMEAGNPFDAAQAERNEAALQALPKGPKAIDLWGTLDGLSDPASAARVMQDRYLRLAGEVEARNTQARAHLDDWDRQHSSIDATADTPADRAIVVFDGKEMASAPAPANASVARGSINLPEDLTSAPAVISLFKGADLSTFIHESGHFFLEVQMDLAARIQAQITEGATVSDQERAIIDDARTVLTWMGVKGGEGLDQLAEWHGLDLEAKRPMHEQWARGFEAYAFEGNAPSLELGGMFQKFRAWMLAVYKELKVLNVSLTDDVRGVMDRMLASTEAIQQAEAARRMGPLFKTAEEAGMTLDEFKAYHALATDASQAAIEDLQARGLRDMRWLSGAKDRKLRELQKLHDTLRREVRAQVRAEVVAQPVYRAWAFLTGKGEASETAQGEARAPKLTQLDPTTDTLFTAIAKLGGLRKDEVVGTWGVDPKERLTASVFGKPVLRKEGGLDIDTMGQRLAEAGYLDTDELGKFDVHQFEEAFDAERRGEPVHSQWFQPQRADEPGPRLPDNVVFGKLDLGAVSVVSGTDLAAKLKGLRMTSQSVGIHPDNVAEITGFSSGDEMVQALAAAEPPRSVIEGVTDQRMLEQHGDLATPEGLQRAVDRAIHNEARARFVASEIKALERGAQVRQATGRTDRNGRPVTVDLLAQVARDQAQRIVAGTKVRNLRPSQYTNAEARAAKAAEKAMAAGDTATALAEKRHQLINLQAAKATIAAQDEVEKAVRYFDRFDKATVRANLPADYLAQIDMLLDKFDLSRRSGAEIDRTTALRTWVQSRLAAGELPVVSEGLLSPGERAAYEAAINARDDQGNLVYPDDDERIKLLAEAVERSAKRSYKEMTVEELRGLRDTVKQIAHLARLKDKLLTARDGRSYADTQDALVAAIEANAKQRGMNVRTDNTLVGGWLESVKQFGVSHIKVATWLRIFDGGKDNGVWWSTIIRPANERANMETTRRAEATARLMGILGPVLKDVGPLDKIGKGRFFPDVGTSLNWEERFTIACNYGNESNLQRLMGGGIAGVAKALNMGQVQAVLRSLSAAEWQAVQAVWDHFESYRPEIAAKQRRVNGVEPEWIAARPFTVQTSDGHNVSLRGGYYPVVFDPRTSLKAQQHADAQAAKDAMKAAYSAATTQRSFTKARVEEVTGRPLLLNLRGLYSGINDVIHDLAWHEWVIDANKLLRSASIDEAIREHYGANVKKEITKWRDDIVAGSKRLDHGIENAAGWARKFTSSAALTYNVMSAALQFLGITQSFARVGTAWVGKGIAQYVAGPVEATRMVRGKSEFMANRTRTMFRDLNELRNRVAGQTAARELMGRYGYFATMHMQMVVDVPTWIGGYEKAIAAGHDEEAAVALADQGVKDSQGGGEEVDQAGITRGGPLVKLFTAFYDFMNTQANVLYLSHATSQSRADAFVHFALVGVATPILAAALKAALTPGDSGDWDEDNVLRTMIREGLANLFGMVAFGREFTGLVDKLLGTNKGVGYSGPTGLRIVPDALKLGEQAAQGDLDDAFRKALLNFSGDLTGIPAVQINRTITGAQALKDGKTANPVALVMGYQEQH